MNHERIIDGDESHTITAEELAKLPPADTEELFVLRKQVAELEKVAAQLASACDGALSDFDNIINAHMVPLVKCHPFSITPAELRSALAAYRTATSGGEANA